jgi:hypothetical protein
VPTLRRVFFAAFVASFAFPIARRADACTSDVECKGDRICEAGVCVAASEVDPSAKPIASPNVAHANGVETASSDERGTPNWATSGPALGVGWGHQTAGLGGVLAIYAQIAEKFRIAPWFGAGNLKRDQFIIFDFESGTVAEKWGWACGMMALVGAKHRFVLDVGYGIGEVHSEYSPTSGPTSVATYGITASPARADTK